MRIQTTYHRQVPDTATGHKIVLTQVFSSMDEREIDTVEKTLKHQYGSGTIAEVNLNEYMFDAYYSEKARNHD